MAVGDIYKIEAFGVMDGVQIINSYHYVRDGSSGVPTFATIAEDFRSKVIDKVRAITVNQMVWNNLVLTDVDPTGAGFDDVFGSPEGGNVTDEALPPYSCWSFLLARTNRTTFNGHKRFAGVPETWQADGVISAGHTTAIGNLATALGQSITDGTLVYKPCILSTILNGVPRTTPLVNLVSGVQFKGITTQNTRKYGRGS